jgi:O-antigen/teichoic acid export membrane protein
MSDDEDAIETIAGGAGVIFSGRVLKILLLFLVEVFLARVLGSTDYGGVVIATVAISAGGLIANLGMPRGIVRKVPYYEDDPAKGRGVLRAAFLFSVSAGAVIGAGVYVMAPILADRIFDNSGLVILFRIGAVGIPLTVLTAIGLSTAKANRTAKPRVVVNHFVNPIGQAVLVGSFVLAGYGAVGALNGRVLAKLLGAVAALYLGYRTLRFTFRGKTAPMYREMLAFSLPLMLASSVDFVISNTDTVLIGAFLTSSIVGVYNAAFKLRVGMAFFHHPITFLLPPVLSRMDAKEELEEAHQTYKVIMKWVVLLTTPLFLAVFFFPRTAILLSFGGQYVGGATALRILSLSVIVTILMGANEKALVSLGHNRISLYVNVAVGAINVALNIALIPRFGIVGAAVASTTAFIFRDIAFSTALYRWEGLHPFSKAMLQPFFGGILLALIGYPLLLSTVGVSVLTVVGAGLLYLVIYVPLSIALGALGPEDAKVLSLIENRLGHEIPYVRRIVNRINTI